MGADELREQLTMLLETVSESVAQLRGDNPLDDDWQVRLGVADGLALAHDSVRAVLKRHDSYLRVVQ